jgi:hypothetical protein
MTMRMKLLAGLILLLASIASAQTTKWFSPTGNDTTGDGSYATPWATPAKAAAYVAGLGSLPDGGVRLLFREGTYYLGAAIELAAAHTGDATHPIIWAGYADEEVRFVGGVKLTNGSFSLADSGSPNWSRIPVAARGNVYIYDLEAVNGITAHGTFYPRYIFGEDHNGVQELLQDGQVMICARWPNASTAVPNDFTKTGSDQPTDPNVGGLSYITFANGARQEGWTAAEQPMIYGMLGKTGFSSWTPPCYSLPYGGVCKVTSVDDANNRLWVSEVPDYGIDANTPYVAYNLLEELDEEGEYYIDPDDHYLYYWPVGGAITGTLEVTTLNDRVLEMYDVNYATFENISFEGAWESASAGGTVSYITFRRCAFKNTGRRGISFGTMNNVLFERCQFLDNGEEAVYIGRSGQSTSLTNGNAVFKHCEFARNGRQVPGKETVQLGYGDTDDSYTVTGATIANCYFHDVPYIAIRLFALQTTIEKSQFYKCCRIHSDSGVIYAGRSYAWQGNAIRYNIFSHGRDWYQYWQSSNTLHIVYLDDCAATFNVYGNIFYYNRGKSIFSKQGIGNKFDNNIFYNTTDGYYGYADEADGIPNDYDFPGDMAGITGSSGGWLSPPWSTAYPLLAARCPSATLANWHENYWDYARGGTATTSDDLRPHESTFVRNYGYGITGTFKKQWDGSSTLDYFADQSNNVNGTGDANYAAVFTDVDSSRTPPEQNWTILANSKVRTTITDWEEIPTSQIGILTELQADFNYDGAVNQADYDIWAAHSGQSQKMHRDGDADRDGDVDNADVAIYYSEGGSTTGLPTKRSMTGYGD